MANAPCAVKPLFPVTHIHTLDPDLPALRRRMNELVVAKIDPDMGKRAPQSVVKNQISRLQVLSFDVFTYPADFF